MAEYIDHGKFMVCVEHNLRFPINEWCPECGRPKHSIDKSSTDISIPHKKRRSRGQNRSQKAINRDPLVSSGDLKNANVGVSSKNKRKITVSHGSTTVGHGMFNGKRKIYERFHNYRLKYVAEIDWDSIPGEAKLLRNGVYFKRLYFENASVQVFRKSILVILRASKEIKGLPVSEAKRKADNMLLEVLNALPDSIRIKDDGKVRALHNAFVNHPTAKYDVRVVVNGETRLITDNSKGNMEFEAVHPEYAVSDSVALELDNASLIDKGLSREFLASAIDSLIKDRYFHAENMRSHVVAIQELSKGVSLFNAQMERSNTPPKTNPFLTHFSSPENEGRDYISHKPPTMSNSLPTISKYDDLKTMKLKKARFYLALYGW